MIDRMQTEEIIDYIRWPIYDWVHDVAEECVDSEEFLTDLANYVSWELAKAFFYGGTPYHAGAILWDWLPLGCKPSWRAIVGLWDRITELANEYAKEKWGTIATDPRPWAVEVGLESPDE